MFTLKFVTTPTSRLAHAHSVFSSGYLEWWFDFTLHLVMFTQYIRTI